MTIQCLEVIICKTFLGKVTTVHRLLVAPSFKGNLVAIH